jgi:hypothetical protein
VLGEGERNSKLDEPAAFSAQAWHVSRQAAHDSVSQLLSRSAALVECVI